MSCRQLVYNTTIPEDGGDMRYLIQVAPVLAFASPGLAQTVLNAHPTVKVRAVTSRRSGSNSRRRSRRSTAWSSRPVTAGTIEPLEKAAN